MCAIDDCFHSIQVRDMFYCEPTELLHKLCTKLRSLLCKAASWSSIPLLTAVAEGEVLTCVLSLERQYFVSEASVSSILGDACIDAIADISSFDNGKRNFLLETIGKLFLAASIKM